jgi:hypothetical protein
MLQEKVVYGFDFAWHNGLSGWKRLSDIAEFQEAAIRTLSKDKKARDIFAERKHVRHEHTGTVIVHDQHQWWNAEALEISSGGVSVRIENSMMAPGQQIHMHFKPHGQFPAFNAVGEIVNKKYIENIKDRYAPIQYGVRFLSLSGTGKEKLMDLLKDAS